MGSMIEYSYYLITCSDISRNGIMSDVKQAISAGCNIVQYREKKKSTKEMVAEANRLKQLCNQKALFLINDRVDVASVVDADGVHLGQTDDSVRDVRKSLGHHKIIGMTVHNEKEAKIAENLGVDYLGLAPIFGTTTKKDAYHPCGMKMITTVRETVNIPLIAVGGITIENVSDVIRAGADGAVAISAVIDSNDVYTQVKEFINIIKEVKKQNDST